MVAIDLGSNTIRAVLFDCKSGVRVKEYEKIVKSADGLYKSGIINKMAVSRILDAIMDIKKVFDGEKFVAVATAAFRIADNGKEVLETLKLKTGIEFRLIDSQEEATLSSLAVRFAMKRLGFLNQTYYIVDIGGGSLELVLVDGEDSYSHSVNVGIVTTAQKYKTKDKIEANISKDLEPLKEYIENTKRLKPELFVATAGTPTTIAGIKKGLSYKNYNYKLVEGTKLKIEDLNYYLELLLKLNIEHREELVGVGRADLIVAGVIIYREVLSMCGFSESIVIDDGLREGLAIYNCLD